MLIKLTKKKLLSLNVIILDFNFHIQQTLRSIMWSKPEDIPWTPNQKSLERSFPDGGLSSRQVLCVSGAMGPGHMVLVLI